MGPAYYKPNHSKTATTAKYKGVHFGNLKSGRSKFEGKYGPGPGDYDPHRPKQQTDYAALLHADGKVYESRLPR